MKNIAMLILVLFALVLASLLLTNSAHGLLEPPEPALADGGDQIETQGDPPGSWEALYPPITTSTLNSVAMVSANDGWAVGEKGAILHYDGTAWTEVESPTTWRYLYSVDMVSATDGWAVGAGIILHYDGITWTKVESSTTWTLYSVDMVSPTDGWAAGYSLVCGLGHCEGFAILLHYDGTVWREEFEELTSYAFGSVSMVSATDGWATSWTWAPGPGILHYDGTTWTRVDSLTAWLNSVDMVSATDGWAVGSRGTILHYDGTTWAEVESPTTEDLYSVDMVSATDGWIVGNYGTILHYDGTAWTEVASPTTETLHSVSMVSTIDGWAVGDRGTILHYDGTAWIEVNSAKADLYAVDMLSATEGWAVGDEGTILRHDGSDTAWTKVESPTRQQLYAVDMVSPADGWAMGRGGTILRYDSAAWTSVGCPPTRGFEAVAVVSATDIWAVGRTILHYDSAAWTEVESPTTARLNSVDMVSATEGWAVGYLGTILRYDGTTWTKVKSPTTWTLYSVDMVSATEGWAVGRSGTILHYDGTTWTKVESPTTEDLYSVDMVSATDGWVVGKNGTVLHYDGIFWAKIPSPTTGALYSVDMVSPTDGWAVGSEIPGGIILHYDGIFWAKIPSPGTGTLQSVDMVSATNGWAMGDRGTILHYNGTAWTEVESPTTEDLRSVAMFSATDGWAVGDSILHYDGIAWTKVEGPTTADLYSVDMVSATEGWAVGSMSWDPSRGVILHYDGTAWTEVESPTTGLYSVDMISATDGWAVGIHGTILHYDGTAWTEVESPTWWPLKSVNMVSATEGWAVGGEGTILYYDGTTWIVVESPTRETLYSVDMVSTTDGWAVGDEGTILYYDGTAWTEVESPTTEMLYSVDMVSATDGWAVGRYGTILHYVVLPPDLSPSTKAVDKEAANSGDTLTYTITLHNAGPGDAVGALVTDTLPALTTYVPDSLSATGGSYGQTSGVITWTGSVTVGLPVTITFQATIDPTLTHSDTITNIALINDGRNSVLTRSATTFIEPMRPVPNPALAEKVWQAIERFVETYPMTDYFPNYAPEHGGPLYTNAEANAWAACFDAPPHLDADPQFASRACTLWQASYLGLYHAVRAQRTGDAQDLAWASAYLDVSLDYLLAFVHGPQDSPTDYGYRDVMVSVWQNPLRAINVVLLADLLRAQDALTSEQLAKFEHAMSAMLWAWHGEWWTTGQHPSHGVTLTTRTATDNPAYDILGHQVVSEKAHTFHWDADKGNTPAEEVAWLGSAVMLASRALWEKYPAYRALYREGQHYLDFAIAYDRPDPVHGGTVRTLNSETSGGAYGQRCYWIENHSPDTPSLPYMGSAWTFIQHGLWASLGENQAPWPELYKDADHWWIMASSLGETLRAPDDTYLVDITPGHQQSYNLANFPEWWTPCSVPQDARQYVQYDGRAGGPPIFMSEIGHSAGQDILNAAWPAMRLAVQMENWAYYDLWTWRINTTLDEFLANPPNPGWIECKTAVYVGPNQAYNWGRLIDVFVKAYLGPAGYQLEPWDLECCVGSQVYLPLVVRGDMD